MMKHKTISYAKFGYLFILPFFIVYLFFQVYPLFYTFYLSTQSNGSQTTSSVGLDNFKIILAGTPIIDEAKTAENKANGDDTIAYKVQKRSSESTMKDFRRVLGNTFLLWIGNFIPQIIISLLLAAWFTDAYLKIKGKGFYKIVMYMPNIITAASVAALFVMLFSDSKLGAINSWLANHGHEVVPFVSGKTQSRVMIMIIQTWMWFGNTTIMLMSGIMGINPSLFEAANIDGASPRQQFFRITLPLLRPILLYTVVTSMIGGLQMYDMPALYNMGTSQNRYTETIAVYIFNNFHNSMAPNLGYSAAASVILFFITAILGAVAFKVNNEDGDQKVRKGNQALKIKLGGN